MEQFTVLEAQTIPGAISENRITLAAASRHDGQECRRDLQVDALTQSAGMICSKANQMVHDCYLFANSRKIAGRPLIDHPLAMAKLADLATREAVLCLRHKILSDRPTSSKTEHIREICRVAIQISAIALELKAGAAFVHEDQSESYHEVLLSLTAKTLAEVEHAQQEQ